MKHLSLVIAIILLPSLAFAADGQSFVQAVLSHLLELAVLVATPLVLLLARKLVQVFEDKTGIDLADKQEGMLQGWVMQGIAYAEEQGQKALKAGLPPISGEEKKVMAVEHIHELVSKAGVDEWAKEQLEKRVEALLHLTRK